MNTAATAEWEAPTVRRGAGCERQHLGDIEFVVARRQRHENVFGTERDIPISQIREGLLQCFVSASTCRGDETQLGSS